MAITKIQAVIFDMDGTLVDSELLTEKAIVQLLEQNQISPTGFDYTQCYGITWKNIEALLIDHFPQLVGKELAGPLQQRFHSMGLELKPDPIPGAQWAVQSAHQVGKTAIGTSSNRESLDEVVERLNLADFLTTTASAEEYERSKPAPDCYLFVAEKLGVHPKNCVVFEDSIPGIRAAKAAGMATIAITHRCPNLELATKLADKTIKNYKELPEDFFSIISGN
jgi:HAD superfamily hydrolase (TIGR01509 family)